MKRPIHCTWCNKLAYLEAGAINRARRANFYLYCGRVCSGFGRRKEEKSDEQKRAEKAAYDAEYREKNLEMLKAKKAARFQATYDPAKAAQERKVRSPYHAEYCRQPEYKAYKRKYDLSRRASEFGEFSEAYMILSDVQREIDTRISRYDVYMANETFNKSTKRRRDYDKLNGS